MNYENEEWILITGLDYPYSISNYGRLMVDGLKGSQSRFNNVPRFGCIRSNGYVHHSVMLYGKQKMYLAHILVMKYFKPDEYTTDKEVNHKDFNKSNNHISNLEMVTPSENVIHYQNSRKDKSSQYIGVQLRGKSWYAIYKQKHLGSFKTEEDAYQAIISYNNNEEIKNRIVLHRDDKFKIEAIRLANKIGVVPASKELGVTNSSIYTWIRSGKYVPNSELGEEYLPL